MSDEGKFSKNDLEQNCTTTTTTESINYSSNALTTGSFTMTASTQTNETSTVTVLSTSLSSTHLNSSITAGIDKKVDDDFNGTSSLMLRQSSDGGPDFNITLDDVQDWEESDDYESDEDDDSLPDMLPGGQPIIGYSTGLEDDSDDELPNELTPGPLVRQNGWYNVATSRSYMQAQRAA